MTSRPHSESVAASRCASCGRALDEATHRDARVTAKPRYLCDDCWFDAGKE